MIKKFVPSSICLACRGCCRFKHIDSIWSVALLDSDIKRLMRHHVPPAVITRDKRIALEPIKGEEYFSCSFLNQNNNICRVYQFRPWECQLYPFLVQKDKQKFFLAVDLNCPYAQAQFKTEPFNKYTLYLRLLLNSPRCLKTIKRNPQILQEYAGTELIAEVKI
ncbi:MAG: YkgJ family cysteine cluster protein [Candidatus Omnitrophica bacterium]|nr:YkgJ family cysteine cluster protein [Candidatus Omnitrophota bacterium]